MTSEISALLLIGAFILFLLAYQFIMFLRAFGSDLRIVNEEIKRSSPSERGRWKRTRRRLFLSLIPFYKPRRKKQR